MALPDPVPESPRENAPQGDSPHGESISNRFESLVERNPNATMLSQAVINPDGSRTSINFSRRDVQQQVHQVANWLIQDVGIEHGDRVGIMSATWPEAGVADMAVLDAGGCNVILYPTDNPQDIAYKLWITQPEMRQSETDLVKVKAVFADNQTQYNKLVEAQERDWEFKHPQTGEMVKVQVRIDNVTCFEPVSAIVGERAQTRAKWLESIYADPKNPIGPPVSIQSVGGDDLAYFIFTSGSTSLFPKAVEVRHKELLNNLDATYNSGMFREGQVAFLPLPLSHSFGQHFKLQQFVHGLVIAYPAVWDQKNSDLTEEAKASIVRDMGEANAEVIPTVPSMLNKMRKKILAKSQKAVLGFPLRTALWAAREVYEAEKKGEPAPFMAKQLAKISKPIAEKIKKTLFGDNFQFAIPGGGFLDPQVFDFFESLGMKVCPGYGFTEASVVVSVIHPDRPMPGSVGEILPEFEVKMVPDKPGDQAGRLFFRGDSITRGYANNPASTHRAISDDGWYDSQDYGYIREVEGRRYLYLVGRSEEIESLSTGENIPVAALQENYRQSRYINDIIVTGQDRKFLVALVDADLGAVAKKADSLHSGWAYTEREMREQIVLDAIRRREEALGLKPYQQVKYVHILDEPPSIENGLMTPSHKLKRGRMLERYKDELEEMWQRKRG